MALDHRPRGVPELIDAAFQLMRRNYVPLLVLSALTYIPSFAVVILVSAPAALSGAAPGEISSAMMGTFVIAFPFLMAWYAIGTGAMVAGASEGYQGNTVDPGSAVRTAWRRKWAIILAMLAKAVLLALAAGVATVIVAIGTAVLGPGGALIAIPAIVLPIAVWVRYFAVPTVTVLEGLGVGASLSRSTHLSAGFRWQIFGTYLVTYAIVTAILLAAMVVTMLLVKNVVLAQIASNLLSLLGFPLVAAIDVVLYYDMRIRKEGYDLELLQRELAAEPVRQPI
jgi:hypothetical protein